MPLPITFLNPDSDAAREALARAMQPIPMGLPILGLVLKVQQTPAGEEKLINFEFADPDLIRALALVLPPAEAEANHTPKE